MALLEMVQNLAIITSLALIYRVITARIKRNSIPIQIIIGVMFGTFTIIGMATPFTMLPGIIYDGRSIILSLAGLFSGPIPTVIAAAIAAGYRISIGGIGVYAGVGTILEASAFGLAFYYLRRMNKIRVNTISLIVLGILVHFSMMLLQLALPGGAGWRVWQEIGLYVMVFFTSATLLIGLLFLDSENQLLDRKALTRSEKTLKKAQQLAQVGNWIWLIKDNHLEGSDEMFRILGLEKQSFKGSLADLLSSRIHPEDVERVRPAWKNLLVGELPTHTEFRLAGEDGAYRTVWSETGEILRDDKGQILGASGILQDITERRTAEREILETETRYRSLIMNSPDAIFVNHLDHIILVNNKCVELFGAKSVSEILGKPVIDFFHPDYHAIIKERIRQLRETGNSIPLVQEKILRLDGKMVDVDVISATFHFHGDDDIHVIVRDITERKLMEKELRDSRDLLARMADQVPGTVFQLRMLTDGKVYFPFASPRIVQTLGCTPQELSADASPAFDRIDPDDRSMMEQEFNATSRTMRELNVEFRIQVPGQDQRWVQCSAKPERAEDGGTIWSGILTDITDRKLDEQKIADQLTELHRWQTVMLGREKRSIELKAEVNALLTELGRQPRYQSLDSPQRPGRRKELKIAADEGSAATSQNEPGGEG